MVPKNTHAQLHTKDTQQLMKDQLKRNEKVTKMLGEFYQSQPWWLHWHRILN